MFSILRSHSSINNSRANLGKKTIGLFFMMASDSDGNGEEMCWIKIDPTTSNGDGDSNKASLQSGPVTGPGKYLQKTSCAADSYRPSLL